MAYDFLLKNLAHLDEAEKNAELRLILEKVFSARLTDIYTNPDRTVSESETLQLKEVVHKRADNVPLAYILGTREFYGLEFMVSSQVLIPRPETELIVAAALERIQKLQEQSLNQLNEDIFIMDMGCGSGCIGQSIIKNSAQTKLLAVDVSQEAIAVAKANSARLGIDRRVQFANFDLCEELFPNKLIDFTNENAIASRTSSRFDIVVANPPYIAHDDLEVDRDVFQNEPHLALFAADEGLHCLKKWSRHLPEVLRSNGIAIFEIGRKQGGAAMAIFERLQIFSSVEIQKDYSGHDRLIVAQK